jgi:hypothetical protein
MVLASSGNSKINYNRIISLAISPYSVSESKTFRDPAISSGRELFALHIIDKNNAVSLIYDSTTLYTDLAKVNF